MAKAGSKNSVVIVVAIVLAVIAAFVYHSDEQQTSQPYEARRLLGALEIEQIGSVAIETGATSVTLTRRSPEEWVIDQRAGYPVDAQKLRQHVLDLVEMEAVDRLTENPDLYGSLGVGPHPAMGKVVLADTGGSELATVYLGETRQGSDPGGMTGMGGGQGQYFRLERDPAVYLSRSQLTLATEAKQWLDRTLAKIQGDDLQRIEVKHLDEASTESFEMAAGDDGTLQMVTTPPEGMRARSAAAGQVSRALSNLTMEDVISAEDSRVERIEIDKVLTATTMNGVVYRAEAGMLNDQAYLRLDASYDAALDLSLSDEHTSAVQEAKAMDPGAEMAESFSERHSPWVYQVGKYQHDNIGKKLSSLIEEIPEPLVANDPTTETLPIRVENDTVDDDNADPATVASVIEEEDSDTTATMIEVDDSGETATMALQDTPTTTTAQSGAD